MTSPVRRLLSVVAFAWGIGAPVMLAQTPAPRPIELPAAHLAAGDDVVVVVFQEKELSARVYVDGRNQITLPRLGIITVSGLTTDMLHDTIQTRYATFLRDPSVDVRALRRITVNGAVLKPDVYYVDPSLTLRDVVARAGGVTNEGDPNRVMIVRGPTATTYSNWQETAQGQTELRSGDELVVGRRSWLLLNLGALVGVAGVLTSLAIAFLRH
ncbi:MAG: polysaccharide export protein [Gemmatimonadetes bacterium]|nr:polysaccharide export protein [Gemmatimonadota bacterium]